MQAGHDFAGAKIHDPAQQIHWILEGQHPELFQTEEQCELFDKCIKKTLHEAGVSNAGPPIDLPIIEHAVKMIRIRRNRDAARRKKKHYSSYRISNKIRNPPPKGYDSRKETDGCS